MSVDKVHDAVVVSSVQGVWSQQGECVVLEGSSEHQISRLRKGMLIYGLARTSSYERASLKRRTGKIWNFHGNNEVQRFREKGVEGS